MNLSDKIWKTRKARIKAEDRCISNDFYTQVLIIYYSLLLIIVTILDMQDKTVNVEVPTLILSISLLVISVFMYAMRYPEKSLDYKNSYIDIGEILTELERKTEGENTLFLEKKYNKILKHSQNHTECDYLKVLYEVRNEPWNDDLNGEFTRSKYMSYFTCKAVKFFSITILFILPVVVYFLYTR